MFQSSLTDANHFLVPLGIALGLSVFVERTVEFLKNASDVARVSPRERAIPPKASALAATDELTALVESDKAQGKTESGAWSEEVPTDTILVEPATQSDQGGAMRVFFLQSVACTLGILAAHFGDVQLFTQFFAVIPLGTISPAGDYLLTGLFIAGGSTPVHALIRFIGDRKVPIPEPPRAPSSIPKAVRAKESETATVAAARASSLMTTAPAEAAIVEAPPVVATASWRDIEYDGGVDRGVLEAIHRRSDDPNKIVFHHTAMHTKSKFQDVVRVIKERTDKKGNHWVTGYHCVILFDGSIHPFCRWDRYGNHAQGHNDRSLGITLNGNFETDPSVPFSNPNGRYGANTPSAAQLDSAARVVALWCHLYGIPADFKDAIIPHKRVSPKTCPGNNFPYADFERLVTFYNDAWKVSPDATAAIAAFARKPYLLTKSRKAVWA